MRKCIGIAMWHEFDGAASISQWRNDYIFTLTHKAMSFFMGPEKERYQL